MPLVFFLIVLDPFLYKSIAVKKSGLICKILQNQKDLDANKTGINSRSVPEPDIQSFIKYNALEKLLSWAILLIFVDHNTIQYLQPHSQTHHHPSITCLSICTHPIITIYPTAHKSSCTHIFY